MRIGFDGKRAVQNFTGLGNYSRYIVDILCQFYPENEYVLYAPKKRENKRLNKLTKQYRQLQLSYPTTSFWKKLSSLWRVLGVTRQLEKERIDILLKCAPLVDYVDIELQSDDRYIKQIHDTGVTTIVSYHDFHKTPEINEIMYIVEKEQKLGDIAKVAFMPNDLDDTLKILAILSHCENTIAISMSDLGSYTRVMASKFDSPITFAAGRDVTAPGQIDIETMKSLLNMDLNLME